MKKLFKNYFKPTPKLWRKIGDALLGVSSFVTAFTIPLNIDWIPITALCIGVIGKTLTNFFKEEKP